MFIFEGGELFCDNQLLDYYGIKWYMDNEQLWLNQGSILQCAERY
jgi:hypothetical protein